MRHIENMGGPLGGPLAVFKVPQAIWPLIDRPGGPGTIGSYFSKDINYPDIRALALHPNTDWDQCEVLFDKETEWRPLLPGVVLRPLGKSGRVSVRPRISSPATLLYDATLVRQSPDLFKATPPNALAGWQVDNSGGAHNKLFLNVSGGPLPVYKWTGTPNGWNTGAPFETVANGAWTTKAQVDGAVGPLANSTRASDFSPDGIWSFAAYFAAGKITPTNPGNAMLPASALIVGCGAGALGLDERGNGGDPTNPSTIQYILSGPLGLNEWARPSFIPQNGAFVGALALDVWCEEDPPPYFRPILPPERVMNLTSTMNVPANTIPGGLPSNPLVTLPALNCDEIQVTWGCDGTSAGPVTLAIASPRAVEGFEVVGQVLTPAQTLAAGGGGAVLRGENVHPFVQVATGAGAGGGKLASGTTITLRRLHTGA